MTKINMEKTYHTKDKQEVVILSIAGRDARCPVIGYIGDADQLDRWTLEGEHWFSSNNNLIEVKPRIKRSVWLNIDRDSLHCRAYLTKKEANEPPYFIDRIACIKIDLDFEEGEGL